MNKYGKRFEIIKLHNRSRMKIHIKERKHEYIIIHLANIMALC